MKSLTGEHNILFHSRKDSNLQQKESYRQHSKSPQLERDIKRESFIGENLHRHLKAMKAERRTQK